jgi:hypothetical protein
MTQPEYDLYLVRVPRIKGFPPSRMRRYITQAVSLYALGDHSVSGRHPLTNLAGPQGVNGRVRTTPVQRKECDCVGPSHYRDCPLFTLPL